MGFKTDLCVSGFCTNGHGIRCRGGAEGLRGTDCLGQSSFLWSAKHLSKNAQEADLKLLNHQQGQYGDYEVAGAEGGGSLPCGSMSPQNLPQGDIAISLRMLILKDMADRNIFISARIFQAVLYKSFKIKFVCVPSHFSHVLTLCDPMDCQALLQPARLYCTWDSPGKNTRVGCLPFSRGTSHPRGQTHIS